MKALNKIWFVAKTVVIAIIVIAVVAFALALVIPFMLFGPKDEFWDALARGAVINAESGLAQSYLNILQWLAGIR